jgi:branched-subunit amino acid aminotransferase/4-amino-4-deoxychorismate lyase
MDIKRLIRSIVAAVSFDTAANPFCGTMSNVFLVRNRPVVIPDLPHAGIGGNMRRNVVEVAHREGITIAFRDTQRDELWPADERPLGEDGVREMAC